MPLSVLQSVLLPGEPPADPALHWIDIVGLALLGMFGLLGALRGLWWQVIRLLGLAAAVAVARALAPRFGPEFHSWSDLPSPVAHGIVWLLLFIAVLVVASLVGNLGKRTLVAVRLGPVDRFGGLLAGLMTALLLHAAFLVGISYFGKEVWASESIQQAESRRLLETVTTRLQLYVGEEDAARLRVWFDDEPRDTRDLQQNILHPGEPEVEPEPVLVPYHEPDLEPAPTPSGQYVR
jgi:uncharacterized membrane protein required for colicin V production